MELPSAFGKYHLLERLAVGGMAEVFLAKSFGAAGFERLLVIKKILPHLAEDEEFITMFIDEARIASTLTHSNIIQINELGKEDNDYYIAMEYMMAKDLSRIHEKISRQKRAVPIPIVVLIASRICEGLEYAHRKKDSDGKSLDIIHRDISPGNVLVSYDGDVKLIDFGIAKAQNRMGRTTAGTLKGKFGYMSPEQVRGMPLDHRSDIFSVGILVYELLTGERLFGAESDFGTLEKVRNAQVEPPTTYNSKIPAELERVVMQALARDPEERYDWASDMQEDLVRFLMQDGSLTTSKSLAAFMRDMFKRELKKENERLSLYRKRGYPWLDAARGDDPQAAKQTMEMAVVTGEEAEQDEEAPPAMADDVPDMSEDEEGHLAERKPEPEPESVVDKDRARVQGPSDTEEMLSADALADAATQVFSMEDIEAAEEAVAAQTGENSAPGDSQPSDSVQVNMGDEQVHQPTMILPDGLASIEGSEDENTPGGDAKGSLDASSVEVEEEALPREPCRPGRSRADSSRSARQRAARNRSRQKRPVRGRTGTDFMGGRGGRPDLGPEPEDDDDLPVRSCAKKKPSPLPLILIFAAGLGLTGILGYFMFVHGRGPDGDVSDPIDPPKVGATQPLLPPQPDAGAASDKTPLEVAVAVDAGPAESPAGSPDAGLQPPVEPKPDLVAKLDPKPDPKVEPKPDPKPDPKPEPKPPIKPKLTDAPKGPKKPKPHGKRRKKVRVAKVSGGRIVIKSTPRGADIFLNGKPKGKTPATLGGLDTSKNYFIVLRKEGYKKFFQGVKFEGKKKVGLTASLKPKAGATPSGTVKAVTGGKGYLVANTTPWAKVIIDGKDTGKWTPIVGKNKIKLPAGNHVLTFKTKEGKKLTVKVTIEAGKTAKVIKKIL